MSHEGQGFRAEVTAGNGNTWFITHQNSVPDKLTGPDADPDVPGGPDGEVVWATGHCTPAVKAVMEEQILASQHAGFFEREKMYAGLDYDEDVYEEWNELTHGAEPEFPASRTEQKVIGSLAGIMTARTITVVENSDQWSQWEELVFGDLRSAFKVYCDMYQGDLAFEYFPSMAPADPDELNPSMTLVAGSTEPFVIGFPYGYDPKLFDIFADGHIDGFKSGVLELIEIEGSPYMTYTLTPDEGGWGSGWGGASFVIVPSSNDPYNVGHFFSSVSLSAE